MDLKTLRQIPRILVCALMISLLPAGNPALAGPLGLKEKMAPHKALYDIEMVSKSSGSQIVNISGQMFYEWKPGCEAWTTDHRFNLFYEYADSPPIRITSDFSTYETFDGQSFDFTSRRKRNGSLYQEIRGRAEMDAGNGGQAVYKLPEGLSYDLKPATLFPMGHSLAVLEKAIEGKKFYSATVFDGSDDEGPVEISAFIGKKLDAVSMFKDQAEVNAELVASPAWKVRMAFFPTQDPNANSDYEMDVVFHENGVISDMLVEYHDFSVTQRLVALEKLQAEDCGAQAVSSP
ncbi:MAG: cell envelope integrity EipB family protein [Rhodospirillales bacterium]|nr:cell envelope integrity EipB family protein [Rhodospirillales bacterium]MCB9996930.1 cell envelope integrity EipB family protein [Rhodospirillales bacterium]